jgi:hypothetical protein
MAKETTYIAIVTNHLLNKFLDDFAVDLAAISLWTH